MRTSSVSVLLVASFGCGEAAGVDPPLAGEDETIAVLAGEHIYFGDPNRRSVDVLFSFPEPGALYDSIRLRFALRCPKDRCDWWDRVGWLTLVHNPGSSDETELEISRFVTWLTVAEAEQLACACPCLL